MEKDRDEYNRKRRERYWRKKGVVNADVLL